MKLYKQTQGQGPLLILLHGWGFSHLVWQDLVPALAKHYTVLNIDLPGFGKSSFDDSINSLQKLSEAILTEIPEEATIMGWSLGGLVAQYLAIHHPEKIKRLIAVSSTPCFIKHKDWPGISTLLLNSFTEELVNNYQKTLKRFLMLQFFGLDVDRELIKKLNEQVIEEKPNTAALKFGLELLLKTDLREELKYIQCPTQFILGKLDIIVPATLAETLGNLNSQIKIDVIKGAGHAPFISHPELFLAATGLFA